LRMSLPNFCDSFMKIILKVRKEERVTLSSLT
jgi:hypothetical protein